MKGQVIWSETLQNSVLKPVSPIYCLSKLSKLFFLILELRLMCLTLFTVCLQSKFPRLSFEFPSVYSIGSSVWFQRWENHIRQFHWVRRQAQNYDR